MRITSRELRTGLLIIAALALLSCEPKGALQASRQTHHAQVELLADPTSLTLEGWPRGLGVHFKLDPGWHIYWQNPGDSGQPPEIKWSLPAGTKVLPTQWPLPERLNSAGGSLMDYGYKEDVLLLVPVELPFSTAKTDLAAQVKYLICREVCIPEKTDLHLSLPAPPDSQITMLFLQARNHLPRMWPQGWKATAVERKDDFVLSIEAGRPVQAAYFFPLEAQQIENAAPQILRPNPRGATIILKKSDQLNKPVEVLRGVLVEADAYDLAAPVTRR